ncbi:hypothetical protein E3U23_07855 [Erythrobacter litoralis]|uniref:SurA N-terminal domain-containing protein n=1 Tax=Erythrobacter litoralis TaxID=39960 RepID=UPI0024354EF9|nr:SurA N-terminal domain-containing protein [Erythrobacter litoralis]MDG6079104.1 hypothetical protein [Erythrobacter litoralis]
MKSVKVLFAVSALALSGCDSSDAPSGQVAATVDGEEITVSQVGSELAALGVAQQAQNPELANRALDAAINRKILAAEARERGLDKTPQGALALQRAEEAALVGLLRNELQSQSPRPSDDEARRFISDNPAMFDQRFVTVVEQLVVPQVDQALLRRMEPIDTLDGVRALLDQNNVRYSSTMGTVDSLTVAPNVAQQLVDLGVGEVYILPQGNGARINAVVSRKTYPISDDQALNLAREMVAQQRSGGQAQSVFKSVIDEKKKTVRYSDEFSAPEQPGAPQGVRNGSAGSQAPIGSPD